MYHDRDLTVRGQPGDAVPHSGELRRAVGRGRLGLRVLVRTEHEVLDIASNPSAIPSTLRSSASAHTEAM